MTFEEWWDRPEGSIRVIPVTYNGWELSCHFAWNAGAAIRDAEIAELKREMQHYLKSAKDLLKENYDLITKREDGRQEEREECEWLARQMCLYSGVDIAEAIRARSTK